MSLRTTRLTLPDWLLAISSTLLLADLFGPAWFAYRARVHAIMAALGQATSANGWDTFTVLGPLTLVVCVAGLAIAGLTATRSSPAMPVVIATLLLPVAFLQAVLVAVRVVLDRPTVHLIQASGNAIEARPGAYIGLVLSVVVFTGVYLSLRRDAVAAEDSPAVIERLRVQDPPSETRA